MRCATRPDGRWSWSPAAVLVTSLGAGKTDNWRRLTAGKSGIHAITRFATEGLKTRIAGTVDFLTDEPVSAPDMAERLAELAIEEAIAQARIGSRGRFPGPLFLAVAPNEIEWLQREELARASGANEGISYDDLLRAAASGRYRPYHERFAFGSVGEALADDLRHRGLADLALDRLRIGRERDPARPRGDPARRNRRRAVRRAPTARSTPRAWCGSRSSPRCRPRTIRRRARRSRSPRTATVSSWPKAPAPWCSRATRRRSRAARRFSASSPAAASSPIRSTAPARARTASRSSAACATPSPMPD